MSNLVTRETPLEVVIIGGGIVGLATALALADRRPGAAIAVLEKENGWGSHQSSRNSGVIHSGIYYKPGSLKARLSIAGNASMVAYCREKSVPFEVPGKLIVATGEDEVERLESLYERGRQHGLEVSLLDEEGARRHEPYVRCKAAIRVPSTGLVDYGIVVDAMVNDLRARGVKLLSGHRVTGIEKLQGESRISCANGSELRSRRIVGCAGLFSDRVARKAGFDPGVRVIPFRGEYHELSEEKRHLVSTMIYPVPDPDFPFLGVHLTRHLDGSVHAGPNAVLALSREGYSWSKIHPKDLVETLTWPGFARFAARHWKKGALEMYRSLNRAELTRCIQEMIPEVQIGDVRPSSSGVRAQAMELDGSLVDDFRIVQDGANLFVVNAPSPAATSSLEIGRYIADHLSR